LDAKVIRWPVIRRGPSYSSLTVNRRLAVSVNEIVMMVNVALGSAPVPDR